MVQWPKSVEKHPMFFTSLVAIVTAAINLGIIYCMNRTDGLDHGLGLASIGIVTFLGTLLSSSIFEEHRHDHGVHSSKKVIIGKDVSDGVKDKLKEIDVVPFSEKVNDLMNKYSDSDELKEKIIQAHKEKSDFVFVSKDDPRKDESGNFLEGIIVGTGIMRKSLAASLVITYIVLIGLSFSAGTLYDSLGVEPDSEETGDATTQSILGAVSNFVFSGQIIGPAMGEDQTVELSEAIQMSDSTGSDETANPSDGESAPKPLTQLLLEKNPETLVGHFTIVITAVVGFYFGSNTLKTLLDARAKDKSHSNSDSDKYEELKKTVTELQQELSVKETAEEILKKRLVTGQIDEAEYDRLLSKISS